MNKLRFPEFPRPLLAKTSLMVAVDISYILLIYTLLNLLFLAHYRSHQHTVQT